MHNKYAYKYLSTILHLKDPSYITSELKNQNYRGKYNRNDSFSLFNVKKCRLLLYKKVKLILKTIRVLKSGF